MGEVEEEVGQVRAPLGQLVQDLPGGGGYNLYRGRRINTKQGVESSKYFTHKNAHTKSSY